MGITLSSIGSKRFEFILARASSLEGVASDEETFKEHFPPNCLGSSVSFPNQGGDALLVAPCPGEGSRSAVYSSLATFMRGAKEGEVENFWKEVAKVAGYPVGDSLF